MSNIICKNIRKGSFGDETVRFQAATIYTSFRALNGSKATNKILPVAFVLFEAEVC